MEKTYTITQSQLDKVLENLSNVRSIMEFEKKDGNEESHQRWLSEFCGILSVLINLGLVGEWDNYRRAEILAEMAEQEASNN